MKKTLALILALALLLGCVSFASAEGTMNRDGLTFPELPNNTLKLTVTTANWGTDQLPTKMQKLWQEKVEEYLGCKLDITWQIAPWNDFRNNESVNLAAGDLSDVNTYSQGTLVNGYGKDEDGDSLVLDIMDYKDYLVYYPEFVEGKAGGWTGVLNDDGTSYVFWDGYDNDLNLAGGQSFSAYAYRFDVLKKYDLKPATTWEEFKALCAFLKEKIDAGEIENAKYVMSNGASWMAFFRGFVGTFHTWDTTYWNGTEWAFGPIEDNFRTMLKEMHELYAAGYIDPEYATDESCDAKAANGNILIVPTNWAGSVQSWNQAKVSEDMEWGLAYLPSSQFGTAWKWGSKLNGKNLGTTLTMGIIISADTEYPEYVVRLIDYQYSEDIYKMLNWGVEGEDFITLEDGTRTYVDSVLNAENPGQELKNRMKNIATASIQTYATKSIANMRGANGGDINFDKYPSAFTQDIDRHLPIRVGNGPLLDTLDGPEKARDEYVKFITDGKVETYAEADRKTKIKASVLMAFSCQGMISCGLKGVSNAFDANGNVPRLMASKVAGDDSRKDSVNLSKDENGNIVIKTVTEFTSGILSLTDENLRPDMYATNKGSSIKYDFNVVLTKESLEKFADADWPNFDSQANRKIENDASVPHSTENAAKALPEDLRLDLDVNLSFSIDVDGIAKAV